MEKFRFEEVIKKGPWTVEEDEVLMKFVKKNGPKDWSSIRSMGLLPRTGKSCRLRWVNKLRPDLKSGCKFSGEEERLVIELQAKYGNKWATIASHLPGRTDNDVKNFWSSRKKRLTRILRSSSCSESSRMISKRKDTVGQSSYGSQDPNCSSCQVTPASLTPKHLQDFPSNLCTFTDDDEPQDLLPATMDNCLNPNPIFVNPSKSRPPPEAPPKADPHHQTDHLHRSPGDLSFLQLPESQTMPSLLDHLAYFPERTSYDVGIESGESILKDVMCFEMHTDGLGDRGSEPDIGLTAAEMKSTYQGIDATADHGVRLDSPDDLFDEFPADIFDFLESLPESSIL